MKLSTHFDSAEFQCRCGCGLAKVSPRLVSALEQLRHELGDKSITIESGRRCEAHNRTEGGAPNSQHLLGTAADVAVSGRSPHDVYLVARRIPGFRGFGISDGVCHLDVRSGPVARWSYDRNGRVVAWPEGEL